jgi:hypothetical protein
MRIDFGSGTKGQRSTWIYSDTPSTSVVLRNQEFTGKFVLGRIKVFSEEVCDVDHGANVGDGEFAVAHAVADPMESHINGFGSLLFYRVRCNADRTRVITHERLRVSKVGEDSSKTSSVLGTNQRREQRIRLHQHSIRYKELSRRKRG